MQIISRSPAQTTRIGRILARFLEPGDIICLYGELGTGKTVLAGGIGTGLGVKGCGVISPTFVLMRCLSGRLEMYHFDLYRINGPEELRGLGYEEFFFSGGISVIEWAERLGSQSPPECLKVELSHLDGMRRLKFSAQGGRYKRLLADFTAGYKKTATGKKAER